MTCVKGAYTHPLVRVSRSHQPLALLAPLQPTVYSAKRVALSIPAPRIGGGGDDEWSSHF